ncbi:hypothetical protein HYT54_03050 [Candidatus Woesearchaeota archaeon]|nr:hypothetical protein [Candidatus Woesearchaeota archaeon]
MILIMALNVIGKFDYLLGDNPLSQLEEGLLQEFRRQNASEIFDKAKYEMGALPEYADAPLSFPQFLEDYISANDAWRGKVTPRVRLVTIAEYILSTVEEMKDLAHPSDTAPRIYGELMRYAGLNDAKDISQNTVGSYCLKYRIPELSKPIMAAVGLIDSKESKPDKLPPFEHKKRGN